MCGSSIVGFGSYHYRYASGDEGDSCLVGFSSRKSEVSLYLMLGMKDRGKLLGQLGKHKVGKGCLHIKRLSDIKVPVPETLIAECIADIRRRGDKRGRPPAADAAGVPVGGARYNRSGGCNGSVCEYVRKKSSRGERRHAELLEARMERGPNHGLHLPVLRH